ncbi:hypothetical protein [Mesorhizobium australicum]|uniref:Uncharacterized protein n=1 Tax=Mesorhizobium australicum TaxID=536018 RepID=A0A1X7PJF7_9HYPH|nr:hypothetical protein [Mesorhizobium australicum]SMH51803.1 hypothetical protein SAMN02982922_4529 [Mesorhizobium australicum]
MIDWDGVIERNVRLLREIVATLAAMAGLDLSLAAEHGSAGRGGTLAGPGQAYLLRPTLPRWVHRAVFRLLRPAEAAVRRLVIVAARDMVAPMPVLPAVARKGGPLVAHIPVSLGLALAPAAADAPAAVPAAPGRLSFPLLDPLPDPTAPPFRIRASGVPRVFIPGWTTPFPVAPRQEPSRNDPLEAGYLRRRVAALSRALEDLPGQARRLARWRARRDAFRKAGRIHRLTTLRPGRAYGLHRPGSPRRLHAVDDVLRDLHYFAYEAQERWDTS